MSTDEYFTQLLVIFYIPCSGKCSVTSNWVLNALKAVFHLSSVYTHHYFLYSRFHFKLLENPLNDGLLKRPIMTPTQILVLGWRSRQRILLLFRSLIIVSRCKTHFKPQATKHLVSVQQILTEVHPFYLEEGEEFKSVGTVGCLLLIWAARVQGTAQWHLRILYMKVTTDGVMLPWVPEVIFTRVTVSYISSI